MMDILCCPTCKSSLQLHIEKEEDDDVVSGMLECVKCNKKYPITDGIPDFVDEVNLK